MPVEGGDAISERHPVERAQDDVEIGGGITRGRIGSVGLVEGA